MNAIYADKVRISGFGCSGGIGGPRTRTRFFRRLGSGPISGLCCFWSIHFIISYSVLASYLYWCTSKVN